MPTKKQTKRAKPSKLKFKPSNRWSLKRLAPFVLVFAVAGTVMLWRTFASETFTDVVVTDPSATKSLQMLGHTKMPSWGNLTGVFHAEAFSERKVVWFRNTETGATSSVNLPVDSNAGWGDLASVMTSSEDLWTWGVTGQMFVRHYKLTGSPLPTSAELVETKTFGDSDSRQGDMIVLSSGAIVLAWHQQGANGLPHGQHIVYRKTDGTWQELPKLAFMSTRSSDQVLAQHPADKSVWLFCNPDAWSSIGAARLVEVSGNLQLDWSDGYFINDEKYGLNGPDPENPFLAAAPDPFTNTIALAYQSEDRKYFGTEYEVAGRIAVARIAVDKTPSFMDRVPVWAHGSAAVGLVIQPGETLVSFRPLDETSLTYKDVMVSRYRIGSWETPIKLGTLSTSSDTVGYGTLRPEFSFQAADGKIHFYSFAPPTSIDTTPPTISLTSPTAGATVSGTVNIAASAADNVSVARVEFLVDGTVQQSDATSPYQFSWNSGGVTDGTHNLTARAYDTSGNTATTLATSVNVDNTPTPPPPPSGDTTAPIVSIASPANNYVIGGKTKSVIINASATDNTAVTKMELFIDGSLKTTSSTGSLNYSWSLGKLSRGQHTIQVKAYDAAGNVGTAQVMVRK